MVSCRLQFCYERRDSGYFAIYYVLHLLCIALVEGGQLADYDLLSGLAVL